ncbi:MAG: phosphoribosylaminoimidazolesuccinocarboxamide synthase [Vicingaceae bacterium]
MTNQTINETNFTFKGQTGFYRGKVRDVYEIDHTYLVMVASDRISAFDHILPREIPGKGAVLNQIAAFFLDMCQDIIPHWIRSVPDPNVAIGVKCEPIRIEMVIRGYLSGHAWRLYNSGERKICGVIMPDGLRENDAFPEPIITPATKADTGHDEDISPEEIILTGILSKERYNELADYTRRLFKRGTEYASKRGLILVDTKYEFGFLDGKVVLMDEIHTPDSSRYFYKDSYSELQSKGERQRQLSKEFIREWLMEMDFQGLEGQVMPEMDDEIVQRVSERYAELYEKLTGRTLKERPNGDVYLQIEERIISALKSLESSI